MTDSFVCIDLETTGLDPKRDKIIEIGAVKVRHGEVEDVFESFAAPGRSLDERIVELTGIEDAQLENAPGIEEILPGLLTFIGEDVLLGHSVLFDYSFIKRAAVNQKFKFEKYGIDTLKIARKYLPHLESRSLAFLCEHFGIAHNAHRALTDARATVELYRKLLELFYEKEELDNADNPGKNLFHPKPLIYHVKRETPITIPQKEQLYKLIDKHKLIIDYNVEQLTRSEASRRIARILAEYGR